MTDKPTYAELEKRIAELEGQILKSEDSALYFTKTQMALNSILSAAPMGIGLVAERKLLWVNQKLCEMVGYKKEELLGRSARILYPTQEEFLRIGREKYAEIVRDGSVSIETRLARKNGQVINVFMSSAPINPDNISEGVTFTVIDISETRRVVEEQQKLVALIEHSNDFIGICTASGKALHINKSGLLLTGLNEGRQNWGEAIFDSDENGITITEEKILPIVLSQGFWKGEGHVRNFQTGRRIPMDISVFPILHPVTGSIMCIGTVMRDITDQKISEQTLIKERNRAQMYLDTAGVILLALDLEGNIQSINKKGCEVIGYSEQEVLHANWFDRVLPKERIAEVRAAFNEMTKNGLLQPEDYEYSIWTKDGRERNIIWHNTLLKTDSGEIESIFCSGLDVTERNQMEKEKEELQIQLIKTQKMEAIGVLAGGIAHDFNNILLPILGYTELLLENTGEDSQTREILNQILQAAKRARSLVKQILIFSRQENQEIRPVNVGLVLNEVLKLIRSTLPTTIEIRHYISNRCGLVLADPTQIHQITMNLVTNAYHAMEEAGGQLHIRLMQEDPIKADTPEPSPVHPVRHVCLSVSDTGAGMEKQVLDRIFDPYFTTKKKGKGTGLGLSVVHGIVKSIKGDIEVNSTPGEGTVFKVYLPVIDTEEQDQGLQPPSQGYARGNERILLVDDESQIIQMESQRLEYLGYEVTSRAGSLEALELFRGRPDQFDLVITDMTMPKMTGGQLAQKILEIRPDIPIIICSGFSEKINAETAREMGVRGFVQKPILINEISAIIRKILDADRMEAGR